MDRRRFLLTSLAGILAAPLGAGAQQAGRVWRIGILGGHAAIWAPFREGLRELGYVEGRNATLEWRLTGGRAERFPALAAELVGLKVDVIAAVDNPAIAAAQKSTDTIPIVMVLPQDPITSGFVRSLPRPGGNITGLSAQAPELSGKALQVLTEVIPTASRVASLWDPTEPGRREIAKEVESAGRVLGLNVQLQEVRSPAALDSLFAAMARDRVDAVFVHGSGMINAQRARIARLALQSRLPSLSPAVWYPEAGGLLSYGLSYTVQFRRAAYYVDRLLRGAKAADLPIEQPTRFELVINLKTAKALGLTIPPSLLARADQVIE